MTHKHKVLQLLSDGKPHSHHELYALHVIAHSRVNDLRNDGHKIEQWREGDDYFYRLTSLAEPGSLLPAVGVAPSLAGHDTSSDEKFIREVSVTGDPRPGSVSDVAGCVETSGGQGDLLSPTDVSTEPQAGAASSASPALTLAGDAGSQMCFVGGAFRKSEAA